MNYKEIRKNYQTKSPVIIDKYVSYISPLLTQIFLKKNFTPNEITIMMIISGVLGAVLFSFGNIAVKIIGIVFIHMWYILDCVDGEVARIKKQFSRFGKEIDYSAHILNHPLFNGAYAISLIALGRYSSVLILALTIVVISMDGILRNLYAFDVIYDLKMNKENNGTKDTRKIKFKFIKDLLQQFLQYPNYALIFPIVYLFDYFLGTDIGIVYLVLIVIVKVPLILKNYLTWVMKIKDIR